MVRISLTPGQPHFCLDCELCYKKCSHRDHPRRIIERCDQHIQNYAHGRFQKIKDFVQEAKIKVQDLAYSQKHGQDIRKSYKKYVQKCKDDSPVNLYDYDHEKQCLKCELKTSSIVHMFRHIRLEHLNEENNKD